MVRVMSFLYGIAGCGAGANAPRFTSELEWLVRVVRRRRQGTQYFSDVSNAACTMSYAS